MQDTKTKIATIKVDEYIAQYRDTERFIKLCKECPNYACSWGCPPFESAQTESISHYRFAYIFGTKIFNREDEQNAPIKDVILPVRRVIDKRLLEIESSIGDARAFFAGSCVLCPQGECTRPKGEKCVKEGMVRPSLESFGFDIGKTTSSILGIELQWAKQGALPDYFTLVSAIFTNDEQNPEELLQRFTQSSISR